MKLDIQNIFLEVEDAHNDELLQDLKSICQWATCRSQLVLEKELETLITTLEELRATTSRQSKDFPAELALRGLDYDN